MHPRTKSTKSSQLNRDVRECGVIAPRASVRAADHDDMSSAGTKPAEAKPDSFALAMDRTWLAHERTLMAWVRTAASMISFGFTIYKFFQFEEGRGSQATHRLLTPRDFALIMVSIGLVSLLLATIGHRRDVRDLALGGGVKRYSQAELVAGIVSVFGLLVLVSTIFRG